MPSSEDDASEADSGLGKARTRVLGDWNRESLSEAEKGVQGTEDERDASSPCTLHCDNDALTPTEPDNEL